MRPEPQSRASSSPESSRTRSSRNGASILPCSRAISVIWSTMVNFTDMNSPILAVFWPSNLRFVHFASVYSGNNYDQVHDSERGQREWFPHCRRSAADRSNEGDVAAVAELLIRGFTNRSRQFWHHALDQLTRREPPRDLPKYGYLLETNGVTVGAILLICSEMRSGGTVTPRCNLSSWYVDPRLSGPMRRFWFRTPCETKTSPT